MIASCTKAGKWSGNTKKKKKKKKRTQKKAANKCSQTFPLLVKIMWMLINNFDGDGNSE